MSHTQIVSYVPFGGRQTLKSKITYALFSTKKREGFLRPSLFLTLWELRFCGRPSFRPDFSGGSGYRGMRGPPRGSPYRYSRAEKITGTKAVNCIKINKNQPEILLATSAKALGSPSLPPSSWKARCQRLCQRHRE